MSGYIIDRENQEIVVNIPNVEQLSTTSVIFVGGLSLSDLENEEVNDILELVEAYRPGPGPTPPTPPTPGPTIEPFYVPGWFEHQDGNWVLIKAGQTWEIRYSDNSSSWTDVSYTAGDVDTWFNMNDEPFRMAKYAKRKTSGATGNNKILAMNLDMPNYLSTGTMGETSSTFLSIWRDPSVINVKIKIDHFEDTPQVSVYGNSTFYGNNQMTTCEIEQYRLDLMNVTTTLSMFNACYSLQSLDLSNWNVSNVTSMSSMFQNCYSLQSLDLSNWNVSNVTSMRYMFQNCYSLQSLDLSNWNVSNVTTMNYTFQNCYSLQSLDLSNWNVSNVTEILSMFSGCYSLQSLDLSNWDISKVISTEAVFQGCYSLQSLDLSNWNVSNVTDMRYMFRDCYSLQSLDLSSWDVSKLTNMYYMFSGCYSLQSLDLSNWDISKVTNMNNVFSGSSSLLTDLKIKSKPKTIALALYSTNRTLSNDSLKWMADNFIDISGDDTYTNTTISGFHADVKSRYMWQYFYDTMTAKGYTIS